MYKILFIYFLLFSMLSCGTLQEEIWVYPDNQAEIEFSMQLGKNMTDPFSEAMTSLLFNSSSNLPGQPRFKGTFSIMGTPINNQDIRIDTVIYYKDLPDFQYDSLRMEIAEWNSEHRLNPAQEKELTDGLYGLLKNSSIRVCNNTPDYFLSLSFKTGKIPLKEFYSIGNYLQTIIPDSITGQFTDDFFFKTQKNIFQRGKLSVWTDMFSSLNIGNQLETKNLFQQLIGKLGMQECISIIHLPGKVKSVSNDLSTIAKDKKTVVTTLTKEDREKGKSFENTIKFRRSL